MHLSDASKITLLYLLRSIARTVATSLFIFIIIIIVHQRLPNVRVFTRGEIVSSVFFVTMSAGLLLGWWRELVGSIMILGGFVAFMVSEYVTSGDAGIGFIFMLFPFAGALYLAYWWLTRT
jgi:hypothetical protein